MESTVGLSTARTPTFPRAMDEEPVQSADNPRDDGTVAEVWYRQRERWLPADDTERLFGPKWRIHEIIARKLVQ